ncbi:MAG: hypothetical protein ABEH43_04365, partial [Flavobacteriales bacterium]
MTKNQGFYNKKHLIGGGLFALVYFLWFYLFIGLRGDHIFLGILILFLYFIHQKTRSLLLGLSGFIIYWLIYDSLRIYPNFMFNEVHVKEIYDWEVAWFGINNITPYE